jgi:hypothetical protein
VQTTVTTVMRNLIEGATLVVLLLSLFLDTPANDNEPKRRGRKPGSPKTPGSGRVKGKPPRIPDDIRAVCREVLGLDNLAIRKRLKTWFESGDGLGSTTFRHVMLMGYGQPKHAMISGDQQQNPLIFATLHGYLPYDSRAPGAARLDARSAQMITAKSEELKVAALEAKGEVIEVEKTADSEVPETLESVDPDAFNPGGGKR